jgi:la-related protein 4
MDSDLYVPISLVANFRRVREWTTDMDTIVRTLRDSTAVIVDQSGTKVKPNISVQRNTVIWRDVPECTEQVNPFSITHSITHVA